MAVKGDRAGKEPLAQRMYAEGQTLKEISVVLDVSETSLRKWKSESRKPGEECDAWDKGRQQKRSMTQRIRDLVEEQLTYVETLDKSLRTAAVMDGLSKMVAILDRVDKQEKTRQVAEEVISQVKKAGLSDAAADDIRRRILGIGE